MIIQGNQEPVAESVASGLLEDEIAIVGVAAGVDVGIGVGVNELD